MKVSIFLHTRRRNHRGLYEFTQETKMETDYELLQSSYYYINTFQIYFYSSSAGFQLYIRVLNRSVVL